MSGTFGEQYYGKEPASSPRATRLAEWLATIIESQGVDARYRIEQSLSNWRPTIHAKLRSATQLGRSEGAGMRVNIVISDRIPPPVAEILDHLDPVLIEVLIQRRGIQSTGDGLKKLIEMHDRIVERFKIKSACGELHASAAFVTTLEGGALKEAERAFRDILQTRSDILGAYFFRSNRIEIYWIPIWLVANEIGVSEEDLALVVIAHEMAHLYTHLGQDADGDFWSTEVFAQTSTWVVEGLAQYYCEEVLNGIGRGGHQRPLQAFNVLLKHLSEPYTWFRDWPTVDKRGEMVREALVRIRTDELVHREAFCGALSEAAGVDFSWKNLEFAFS